MDPLLQNIKDLFFTIHIELLYQHYLSDHGIEDTESERLVFSLRVPELLSMFPPSHNPAFGPLPDNLESPGDLPLVALDLDDGSLVTFIKILLGGAPIPPDIQALLVSLGMTPEGAEVLKDDLPSGVVLTPTDSTLN